MNTSSLGTWESQTRRSRLVRTILARMVLALSFSSVLGFLFAAYLLLQDPSKHMLVGICHLLLVLYPETGNDNL